MTLTTPVPAVATGAWDVLYPRPDVDLTRVRSLMARPVMVDARNLLDPAEVARAGLRYEGIGRRSAVDLQRTRYVMAVHTHARARVATAAPFRTETKQSRERALTD